LIEEGVSIIEEIKKGRYEASVIATFNAYFPFYEEVVLGHLRNAGSNQNVLLMDARVCGGILGLDSLRPHYAGREYFLLPINVRGAFHPKLVLLLGKNKSLLLVGSHNLTLAGFSHNRELTNRFEIDNQADEQAQLPFQKAWRFVTAWAASQGDLVQEVFDKISQSQPWLIKSPPMPDLNDLVCVLPGAQPLFDQVLPRLPTRATRIIVTGPFFDIDLAFLRRLRERYPTADMVVGIDPNTVVITDDANASLPDVRFVMTEGLKGGKGYMHAKAVLFQNDDSDVLITGSANPSATAWVSPVDKGGNVEAVVIHNSPRKASIGRLLGLSNLYEAPSVSAESWHAIATNRRRVESALPTGHAPLFATASDLGIEIDLTSLKQKIKSEVRLLDARAEVLQIANGVISNRRLIVEVTEVGLTRRAAMVELQTDRGTLVLAIIHHPAELRELAQTDRQKRMKQALDSLTTDTPLIEDLMRVVEKVIFDEELVLSKPNAANGGKQKPVSTEKVQTQFSIQLKDVARRHTAQTRIVSSGDLAALLDALIHQLGVGLDAQICAPRSIARSEEELVDSDDDEILNIPGVDIEKLVALCQRKIRTVLRRMIRQLENAVGSTTGSIKVLVQLAAVLGLVHRLCQVTSDEVSWIRRGETLVPGDARYQFFLDASRLLYSPKKGLMSAAISASGLDSSMELTMVRGLLIWLAWDNGIHVNDPTNFETAGEIEENLRGVARLLAMVSDLMSDPNSVRKAREAIDSSLHEYDIVDYDRSWLSDFEAWCDDIVLLLTDTPREPLVSRQPDQGDIVYPFKLSPPQVAIVIEATQGKVTVGDLDSPNEFKKFGNNYVRIVRKA